MWRLIKSTDNRREVKEKRLKTINGRTWTPCQSRCQMLEDIDGSNINIKLKFEDGDKYVEVLIQPGFVYAVWERFKSGASIEDSLSFFGLPVPACMKSRRASEDLKEQ